ncbi:MAG: hypothetical protein A3F68_12405 [Acidobacteria bacterium RIFCSPLOWO2_12_FULL_54_10]|nr:MAG: hypothetical protein A3F68_12405 [Acidobacteria bacterium RIFCSPLOWO2_12_FULL_54_10]
MRERDPARRIVVPDEPERLHVLARRTLVPFSRKQGTAFASPEQDTLDVRVSPDQVRLMYKLITALEARGHTVPGEPGPVIPPRTVPHPCVRDRRTDGT